MLRAYFVVARSPWPPLQRCSKDLFFLRYWQYMMNSAISRQVFDCNFCEKLDTPFFFSPCYLFDLTSDYNKPCCQCQHKQIIISVECKYHLSVISLHINLYQNFTAFAPNIIVTLPMSQIVLWHINDFPVAKVGHNAFPFLFGVSATVTWFRNHWCISIRCNYMLVSLRSIYHVSVSPISERHFFGILFDLRNH